MEVSLGRSVATVATRNPPFVFGGSVFILGDNGGLSQDTDRFFGPPCNTCKWMIARWVLRPSAQRASCLFTNGYGIFAVDAFTMQLLWSLKADFLQRSPRAWSLGVCGVHCDR